MRILACQIASPSVHTQLFCTLDAFYCAFLWPPVLPASFMLFSFFFFFVASIFVFLYISLFFACINFFLVDYQMCLPEFSLFASTPWEPFFHCCWRLCFMHLQKKKTSSTFGPAKTPLLFWNVTKICAFWYQKTRKKYTYKNKKLRRRCAWLCLCINACTYPLVTNVFAAKYFHTFFIVKHLVVACWNAAVARSQIDRQTSRTVVSDEMVPPPAAFLYY